jgi:thiol-disulfide isomerase/thioredoxin
MLLNSNSSSPKAYRKRTFAHLNLRSNMLFRVIFLPIIASVLLLQGCISADDTYSQAAPGRWRGMLDLAPVVYQPSSKKEVIANHEQFAPGQLPFEFDVVYTSKDKFYVEIINGAERIKVDDVTFGRSRRTARDTIRINFPEYQSYLIADIRGGMMNGYWVVASKEDYRISFSAKFAENYRFTNVHKTPTIDLNGQWASLFDVNGEAPEKAIGEFKQTENRLEGTFRTETGDYRYLDGTVEGDKFWMSCFDGAHAFLFSGKIIQDTIQGEFRSGTHYKTQWAGWRDAKYQLASADSLSVARDGGSGITFELPAAGGGTIKYPSQSYDGKVKIFTISGTWCPNCKDEQLFLKEYLAQNPSMKDKISIVSFAFERYKDSTQVMKHLVDYSNKLGLDWPVVLAGTAKKEEAQRVFPSLSKVVAFPTMMILDKKGKVRKVHTGFDGPATSKYAGFKAEFGDLVTKLVAE